MGGAEGNTFKPLDRSWCQQASRQAGNRPRRGRQRGGSDHGSHGLLATAVVVVSARGGEALEQHGDDPHEWPCHVPPPRGDRRCPADVPPQGRDVRANVSSTVQQVQVPVARAESGQQPRKDRVLNHKRLHTAGILRARRSLPSFLPTPVQHTPEAASDGQGWHAENRRHSAYARTPSALASPTLCPSRLGAVLRGLSSPQRGALATDAKDRIGSGFLARAFRGSGGRPRSCRPRQRGARGGQHLPDAKRPGLG